ncbi:MAG: diaminopimelate epimerase [Deltaproteobacteria bacterium]|nr:diaminopimelate epimerase [Deltaproteobacteria bacterium]
MELSFIKVQGTGNDFVFIDQTRHTNLAVDAALTRRLCDRNFGIGADGVLLLTGVEQGRPVMRILNADGSIAEMCGNGLRCFARVLSEHLGFHENPLVVKTDAGLRSCRLRHCGGTVMVSISMGPIRDPRTGELLHAGYLPECVRIETGEVTLYPASTGNPHAIVPGRFSREEMARLGAALARHPFFPNGTNVEFMSVPGPGGIDLVVFERGVGFTLACGTGAVATAAVAAAMGLVPPGEPVTLHLPGGDLSVTVRPDFSESLLEGPAEEVFSGRIQLD